MAAAFRIVDMSNQGHFEPPQGLFEKIMQRIELEKLAASVRRRFLLSALALAAVIALSVPVWQAFLADLARSGFAQYLNLAIHDFGAMAADWQDFGLTLLESLPVVTLAAALSLVMAILICLKFAFRYSKGLSVNSSLKSH